MARLAPEQWAEVRKEREQTGASFRTLAEKYGVSDVAISKKAKSEKWAMPCQTGDSAEVRSEVSGKVSANFANKQEEANAIEAQPFKSRETPLLDELDRDEPRQAVFVREYVKDLNATQAAVRAGYSTERPDVQGARLLADGRVQPAIRELRDELLRGIEIEAKDVLQTLILQLNADINEISQYRRVCCRSCHGTETEDGKRAYQCTPLEHEKKKLAHDRERARTLDKTDQTVDIGEFPSYEGDWYDKRRAPNPDCPECFGEGLGEVYFGDTRKLSKAAKALYGGVKAGKDGIEIIVANREKVIDQLARTLGMFKENINVNVAPMNIERLQADFERMMKQADERQRRVLEERGIPLDGEFSREG